MISAVTAWTPVTQSSDQEAKAKESPIAKAAAAKEQAPTVVKQARDSGITDSSLLSGTASGIVTPVDTSSPNNPATHPVQQDGANLSTAQAPASDGIVGASIYNSLGHVNSLHPTSGTLLSAAA